MCHLVGFGNWLLRWHQGCGTSDSDGFRQEAGDKLRVTVISPGFTATNFASRIFNAEMKAQLERSRDSLAMKPETIEQASHCYQYENALGDCGKPPLLL